LSESRYIHGTAKEEQARLSQLNQLLNDAALRELRLRGGERIVDFGCGLAQLTRAMARQAGTRAVGLERSAEQIAEAMRQARWRPARTTSRMPGSFWSTCPIRWRW
jgi:cyclopropane fatty-acyl-phospholipid synthase-like methyltransferase